MKLSRLLVIAALTLACSAQVIPSTVEPAAAAPASIGAVYTPVSPTRLVDTRTSFGASPAGRIPSSGAVAIKVVGRPEIAVPADATAVVVNVAAVNPAGPGFFTAWPAGAPQPTASVINYVGGSVRANLVTVKVGAGGTINLFSSNGSDAVVDIFGYYSPVTDAVAAGRVVMAGPKRAYDSRESGGRLRVGEYRTVDVSAGGLVPAGAKAAILNVTVTDTSTGYLSVLPASPARSGPPSSSNINAAAGETVANQVIIPLTDNGTRISVYSMAGTHVIVDVFGYVTGADASRVTSGLFVPLANPARFLDTRGDASMNPLGATLRLWPRWTVDVDIAGRSGIPEGAASGLVGNLTYVDAHAPGFITAFPAGYGRPGTSSINASAAGEVIANHQMVPITSRGVSLYSMAGGHLVMDVAGYITGSTSQLSAAPPYRQVAPEPAWPMTLSIGRTGQNVPVDSHVGDDVIDRGRVGWFPGTGYPGRSGAVVMFGHRTTHGGVFRGLNLMQPGDMIALADGVRTAQYQVYDPVAGDRFAGFQVIHESQVEQLLTASPQLEDQVILIACTQPDGSPTSTSYRILVFARLVSYTNS